MIIFDTKFKSKRGAMNYYHLWDINKDVLLEAKPSIN